MFENFDKADTEAQESMISETERQLHLARQFCKYNKAIKLCKDEKTIQLLERCKRQTLKLMERC